MGQAPWVSLVVCLAVYLPTDIHTAAVVVGDLERRMATGCDVVGGTHHRRRSSRYASLLSISTC